ncbi:hypothetical protein CAL26_21105 [Bordetella genomosp. 9]|uniref:Tail tubular protein B n=1 Tax=Bordetella genomosp. 9 TaxID=1416803 RepID=A0A261R4U7_9BORD|nr:hypothetical protein [Bordetella genomosp. 9]OZI20055.1 hypothetical protein CAL26_21105 [Bordetella genomosp. 9]
MARVASSYASVTRGVSEQVPQDRLPGQHWEQVNVISDPRRGISRRHGSVTMDEKALSIASLSAAQQGYLRNYREYSFFIDGTEYSLHYQSAARTLGDTLPFCFCFNKDTGKFLNVQLQPSAANALNPWVFGGLSAITTVGKYIVMASNQLGPGYTTTNNYAAQGSRAVAWVRGGSYSRTFKMTVRRSTDGAVFSAAYTTLSSSYPNLLDTSDIVQDGNSNYQKQVNDRVNAYNSAVNKWIGDAMASVQPQFIAAQLIAQLVAQGFTNLAQVGGSIIMENVSELSVDDSGDGTLFRAVFNEVDDPAKLSTVHWAGKVVRVKPKGTDDSYYMVAKLDTGASWGTVTWVEGPAQVVQPGQVFALATLSADKQTLIIADSPARLQAVLGTPVPGYAASVAGDTSSKGAVPYFFGRRVTLLTVFMDRLVIVADGVIFMSRAGDYFNWFRASMLRDDADDPIEAYALGAEDDIITKCVTYNKDLFLFGQRNQYSISGRAAVTPSTIAISTSASEKDSVNAQPIVVANLLFYGKYESAPNQAGPSPFSTSVSQFQLGLFEDAPEPFLISQQLDKYMRGRPIQFAALPSPHTIFVRTDGYDMGLYVYRFIDQPGSQQRVFDSWSRWEWSPVVGRIIGITTYKATLYAFTIRQNAQGLWAACEQFVMDSDVSPRPYLDMLRTVAAYRAGTGFLRPADSSVLSDVYVAADQGSPAALLGAHIADQQSFYTDVLNSGQYAASVGVHFDSDTDLTSPYVRDQNDRALVNGRLVVNRYTVSLTQTGGMDAYRVDSEGERRVFGFNGRRVGLSNNQVGRQPVSDATVDIPCGRANVEHRMSFRSRGWLPCTISAIEWVGQIFNNSRRV